jgi:NADH:ubiquinone reductase (H+-translocating)
MDRQVALSERPSVIVLGAGYAGFVAALRLSQRAPQAQITVVAASALFEQRIRLRQLAVGQALPARTVSAFSTDTGVRFRHGRVTEIAAEARQLNFDDGGSLAAVSRSAHGGQRAIDAAMSEQ